MKNTIIVRLNDIIDDRIAIKTSYGAYMVKTIDYIKRTKRHDDDTYYIFDENNIFQIKFDDSNIIEVSLYRLLNENDSEYMFSIKNFWFHIWTKETKETNKYEIKLKVQANDKSLEASMSIFDNYEARSAPDSSFYISDKNIITDWVTRYDMISMDMSGAQVKDLFTIAHVDDPSFIRYCGRIISVESK